MTFRDRLFTTLRAVGSMLEGANQLRLECGGGNLVVSVNGERLLTATDTPWPPVRSARAPAAPARAAPRRCQTTRS